jgi:hypothetical protein
MSVNRLITAAGRRPVRWNGQGRGPLCSIILLMTRTMTHEDRRPGASRTQPWTLSRQSRRCSAPTMQQSSLRLRKRPWAGRFGPVRDGTGTGVELQTALGPLWTARAQLSGLQSPTFPPTLRGLRCWQRSLRQQAVPGSESRRARPMKQGGGS